MERQHAFRIEARGWLYRSGNDQSWDWKTWYAPEQVRRPVAYEWVTRGARSHRISDSTRFELTAYKQA